MVIAATLFWIRELGKSKSSKDKKGQLRSSNDFPYPARAIIPSIAQVEFERHWRPVLPYKGPTPIQRFAPDRLPFLLAQTIQLVATRSKVKAVSPLLRLVASNLEHLLSSEHQPAQRHGSNSRSAKTALLPQHLPDLCWRPSQRHSRDIGHIRGGIEFCTMGSA